MIAGLVLHEDRMRANLDLTHGLIVAEAVMMAAAAISQIFQYCAAALRHQSP
jgi:adenylosuccinate lyase